MKLRSTGFRSETVLSSVQYGCDELVEQ
ncbi:hypothetical protein AHF37_11480 [Paragonimus kellicotti]|nr:hypothetical protein AHF37_11480 [Paragonimus kellicotti]